MYPERRFLILLLRLAASPTSRRARWSLIRWACRFDWATLVNTPCSTGRNDGGENYDDGGEGFHSFTYDPRGKNQLILAYENWRDWNSQWKKVGNFGEGQSRDGIYTVQREAYRTQLIITRTRLVTRQSRGRNNG